MTVRVGPKGQVVVPKAIRDRIGLAPGDDVEVDEVDGEVRIRRARRSADFLGALGPADGMRDWAAARNEERARERRRDDRLADPAGPT